MLAKIKEKFLTKKAFFKGSSVLALTTLLSYILGLLRDRVFARTFGAAHILDAYNAAFTLPDLILNIFVAGALTAAFVPIFSDLTSQRKFKETGDFINSVLNGSLLVVLLSGLAVFALAPQLSNLIVPGFSPQAKEIFINLTRLLLLSPLIFSVSNTLGNILVAQENFFWFGISAALYNLGIIAGAVFLTPYYGIYGVAIGTIAGALLHLATRVIGLKYRYRWRPVINFSYDYRRFLKLILPKVVGHPIEQLTFLGFTIIASTISAGSIAILNFARNFQSAPINIIGATFALTAFPLLTRAVSAEDRKTFRKELSFTFNAILLISAAAAVVIYFLRRPLITILLGGGAFNQTAIGLTAATLGIFALSIPTESLSHLLARGFYAKKDSLTPVLVGLGSLVIAVASAWGFAKTLGVPGLAWGFFMGSILKTALLYALLNNKS